MKDAIISKINLILNKIEIYFIQKSFEKLKNKKYSGYTLNYLGDDINFKYYLASKYNKSYVVSVGKATKIIYLSNTVFKRCTFKRSGVNIYVR